MKITTVITMITSLMEIPLLIGRTGWRKKASCNICISSSSSGPLINSTSASVRKDSRRLVAHCSTSINRWDQDAYIIACCPGLSRRLWRTANGKKLTTAWRSKQHCRYSVSHQKLFSVTTTHERQTTLRHVLDISPQVTGWSSKHTVDGGIKAMWVRLSVFGGYLEFSL